MKNKGDDKGIFEINMRQRTALRMLWRDGPLSRSDLHEKTGVNPNAIGTDMIGLLREEIVRECAPLPDRRGRPRVPLEIDAGRRQILGLAFSTSYVEAAQLNLRGELVGEIIRREVQEQEQAVEEGRKLLETVMTDRALGIGVSTTGFINQNEHSFTSALPGRRTVSLQPIYDAFGGSMPITLENDMHALAARWMLTHESESDDDVLLVCAGDGQLGAAVLVEGRPNKGSISGGNELGHTRFFTPTDPCYCGHAGCLERIVSSSHIRRLGGKTTLAESAAAMDPDDAAFTTVLDYFSMSLANTLNFLRPNRLVICTELARNPKFNEHVQDLIQKRVLTELIEQIKIDFWPQPTTRSAETAGWLALATLYQEGWTRAVTAEVRGSMASAELAHQP